MHLKRLAFITMMALSIPAWAAQIDVMFTPEKYYKHSAFDELYRVIKNAQKEVLITVYSLSQKEFEYALKTAAKNGAAIKVVLHPDMRNLDDLKRDLIPTLEKFGARYNGIEFKVASMNMHEKLTIVDAHTVVNTSANFSGGARTRYSENFVFFRDMPEMTEAFRKEFSLIWNSSYDVFTRGEDVAEAMPVYKSNDPDYSDSIELYSSSMNFSPRKDSRQARQGKIIKLVPRKTWVVTDKIIEEIDKAKSTIYGSINHLFLSSVKDALIKAVKRGVDVKLTVDNQEYRDARGQIGGMIQTPHFVRDWRKWKRDSEALPPVRVKYYSHGPNPAKWLLNHNKTLLIDYNSNKPVLITGSHNFSRRAEQGQFDNMIVFRSKAWSKVYKSFHDDFWFLWNLNRTQGDRPNKKLISNLMTFKNSLLPIHQNTSVSLAWNEIEQMRETVLDRIKDQREKAGLYGRFIGPFKMLRKQTSSCKYYSALKDALLPKGCCERKSLGCL